MASKPTENVTFIHTADLHLGRPFDSLGSRAEQRREDLRATFREIVEHAVKEQADLFLVAGDLFDSPCPPPADREAACSGFRRLQEAGVKSFAIPGNHDFYIPGGVWSEIEAAGAVVFSRPRLEHTVLPDLGVKVYGMAYDRERPMARPLEGLDVEGMEDGGPGLFLFHGSLDVIGEGYDDAPFSEAEIGLLPFTYVALGHYHGHRQFGAQPTAAYPGSPEGFRMSSSEAGERCFLLGRLEARGDQASVRLEKVAVGRRQIRILDIDVAPHPEPESLFEAVRSAAGPDDLLSLRLTGFPTSEVWEAASELEDRFAGAFFNFQADLSRLAAPGSLPEDGRFILGRFCENLRSRIEEAEGDDRAVLEAALRLGLTAAVRSKSSSSSSGPAPIPVS